MPPSTPLRELAALEDGERAYQVDQEVEVDPDLSVGDLFGDGPGHIVVHHCREIVVTIDYAGASKVIATHPSMRIRAVLARAIKEFGLDPASSADLVLRLPGSADELVATHPIGAYVPKGSCAVTLDLVHLVRPQG